MNGVVMQADYALIHADALRLPLRDASVDAIITSPPYFALRSYQDGGEHYGGQIGSEPTPADFLESLWSVTDELWRVLKPTGSLWVNLGDKYAGSGGHNAGMGTGNLGDDRMRSSTLSGGRRSAQQAHEGGDRARASRPTAPDDYNQSADVPVKSLMGLPWRYALGLICPDDYRDLGIVLHPEDSRHPQWTLRSEAIWSKPNGLPESVTDRVRRSHEQWFHLTKQGRYYAAVDEIREAHVRTWGGTPNGGRGGWDRGDHLNAGLPDAGPHPSGALPGSVWTVPSEPLKVPAHLGVDHFAAFPQELVRRIILGWTPPGICTACGEGRVPVVTTEHRMLGAIAPTDKAHDVAQGNNFGDRRLGRAEATATITGYSCACDVTLAPTRPALVLDPFVGTGTVPMVARALGRYGVGVDLSRDYLRLARWRISQSRHGAKSINRTNRERQGKLL